MNNIKTKIKAILFDMDGTIINTENIWKQVTIDFLASHGIIDLSSKDQKLLDSFSGIGLSKSADILKTTYKIPLTIEQMIEQKSNLAAKYFSQKIDFIEGFQIFHQKLVENQILTGLATNADIKTVTVVNSTINLNNYFDINVYSAEHIGNKLKPDPALFLHALEKLKTNPDEAIIFEDSLYGFQAANKAGVKCIAIKNEMNKDLLHYVDESIENYHQAEEALTKIINKKS